MPDPGSAGVPLLLARGGRKPNLAPLSYVSYEGSVRLAIGECCAAYPSRRVVQAARDALRTALTHAVAEEESSKNVVSLVKVHKPRRGRIKPWIKPWSVVEGALPR